MFKKELPLSPSTWKRLVAKEPTIALKNRFAEHNPVLDDNAFALISRPGMKKFAEVGPGHIRKVYSAPGVFDDDLFVVSGTFLYRVSSTDGTSSLIGELSTQPLGSVSMAATAPIGTEIPPYLFIAEGGVLWYYTENGGAVGHLEASGTISNGDQVRIDSVYYQFTTGSVDSGTPDGSSGNPWLIKIEASVLSSFQNLFDAINDSGEAGTQYSTDLTEHPTVSSLSISGTALTGDLYVYYDIPGIAGNSAPTTETGANLSWDAATLQDGGSEALRQVTVPDDLGAISLAHINSYVIVVPIQDEDLGTNGRFYWIKPGEITIDPLDFATAERSPDNVHQVVVFSDMFWLCGQKTTEPWITTGNADAPMERYRGILFDRGSWEGTALQVKDSLMVVDEEGAVWQIKGGLKRITENHPDIEERIRRAIEIEKKRTP